MSKIIFSFKEGAKYIFRCKKLFFSAAISNIICVILGLLIPIVEADIINTIVYKTGINILLKNVIIFFVFTVFYTLSLYLTDYYWTILQPTSAFYNKCDKLARLQNASIKYLSKHDTTAMADKVSQACCDPPIFFYDIVVEFPKYIILIITCFIMIIKYNVTMSLMVLLVVIIDLFSYRKFKNKIYDFIDIDYELASQYEAHTRRQLSNAKYIRQHGMSTYFMKKFSTTFFNVINNIKACSKAKISYKMVNNSLNLILKICIYIFMGISVIKGNLTVGIFTLLIQYTEMLMTTFNEFYEEILAIQEAKVAGKKLEEYGSVYSYKDTDKVLKSIKNIDIDNLNFCFDNKVIFDNYSLHLTKGKIYKLNGNNGSGKSTLINILLGLYMGDYTGEICYNGINLNKLNITQLNLLNIGLTEQEPNLLDESIRYNIAFTNETTFDDRIMKLARVVNLEDFINKLPNNLSTQVNINSANLSGGQKQKLSIMKALYKNPDVLILDEPTSAIDIESKSNFKDYLLKTKNDRITIIISHDKDFNNFEDCVVNF